MTLKNPDEETAPESLEEARARAEGCTRCPLYKDATQVVFGEGPEDAAVMFVGEQPGDQEDLAGKPFIGPAGQLLDDTLAAAGIDRSLYYVTNAVKHFKFAQRGKRRIHQKPNVGEVKACNWWLRLEHGFIRPKLVVAMGATAARAATGNDKAILKRRGSFEKPAEGWVVFITVHPSSVLRAPDEVARQAARSAFRKDMERVADYIGAR